MALRAVVWLVASACSSDRLLAPPTVWLDGATVRLEAYLDRDFQPGPAPDQYALMLGLRFSTVDGTPIPATLQADSAWVINGTDVWATPVAEETPRVPGASYFQVMARYGPKWEPGTEVDVLVRLRDAAGHHVLLEAPRQLINQSF